MKKHIFLFFMIMLILFSFIFGFQKEQKLLQPEKHEVIVNLVLIDVIVTKGGKFITDLTKDDFELYEDGNKIPINSFELISFGEREVPILEKKGEEFPPGVPKKQLVVVFDGVSSWQRNLKEGSRKIVDELVALAKLGNEVMVLLLIERGGIGVLQPFTTEEELIRKALIKASGSIWFDRSIDAVRMWQEVGIEATGEMAQVDRFAEQLHPTLEHEYLYVERGRFEEALGGLLAVTNMIKDLPGRKAILLISDGFPDISAKTMDSVITETTPEGTVSGARSPQLDIRKDTGKIRVFDPFNILEKKKIMSGEEVLRELIRFANAQNISIYSLDPDTFTKHLIPTTAEYGRRDSALKASELRTEDKISRVQNLRWLSEDTGAVSLRGAKKYDNFYKVMSTDLNYYYQLSYYSPREKPDNEYHKIKVKISRSGLNVRFRKGYIDYSEKEREKILLVSAFYNPGLFKHLPFEAEFIALHKDSKKYEPWMNIALPVRELFVGRGVEYGYGPKKFNLHVWIKDKARGEKAFGGQIIIPFNIDSSFMDFIKTTDYLCFHYKGPEIPFSQKEYQAIFALYDDQTNEIGAWESSLSLPNLKEKKQGTIINCVLGFITANPKKGKKSFSISKKDGGLEYDKIRFFPSVTNKFQRMQDASVFLQIHLPQGKMELNPKFKISGKGRLRQRIRAEIVAEYWSKKSKVWSGIFNLNLRPVIFGDYSLEVEIPVSEGAPVLSKEVKLIKLRY